MNFVPYIPAFLMAVSISYKDLNEGLFFFIILPLIFSLPC